MKLRLIAYSLILLAGGQAFANNYFIPNYYRNRRFLNSYSAVGWSDRKEAGLTYSIENTDEKTNGTKTSDSEEMTLRPHVYYRTPVNLNIEAVLESSKNEKKSIPATGSKAKEDTVTGQLGLGYELAEAPVAFGLVLRSETTDQTSSSGTKTEGKIFDASLGLGYRLDGNVFLGLGYTNTNEERKNAKDDKRHMYAAGVGKVYGDRANPMGSSEAIFLFQNENSTQSYGLTLQGLINAEELQYYGSISYSIADGLMDTTSYGLGAGVDYKFADFYVGPQLGYDVFEVKTSGNKIKFSGFRPSLEAGYRIAFFEAFLRYDLIENESKLSNSVFRYKSTDKGNVLTANLAYKF